MLSGSVRLQPSRGDRTPGASGAATDRLKAGGSVSPDHQNREREHWFMAPARIEQPRVPPRSSSRSQKRLGFAATSKQDVSTVPGRRWNACEMTKGPGAPDRTSTLEAEDPEFLSGSGCAYRLDA